MIVLVGHFFLPTRGGLAALGVYIFFTISGFLITRLMFIESRRSGQVDLRAFYLRRLRRLIPVLVVYLLTVTAVQLAQGGPVPIIDIASVLFYFVNYLGSYLLQHGSDFALPINPFWSLSVEEHFYFLMPLALVFMKARPKNMLVFAFCALAVPLLIRTGYFIMWGPEINDSIIYRHTETRIDSIAFGVLIAVLCELPRAHKALSYLCNPLLFLLAFPVMLAAAVLPNDLFDATIKYSIIGACTVPIVVGAVFSQRLSFAQSILNWKPVVWVGTLSYSLYVWHAAAGFFLGAAALPNHGLIGGVLKMLLAFCCAIASFYLVERPALNIPIPRRGKPALAG